MALRPLVLWNTENGRVGIKYSQECGMRDQEGELGSVGLAIETPDETESVLVGVEGVDKDTKRRVFEEAGIAFDGAGLVGDFDRRWLASPGEGAWAEP